MNLAAPVPPPQSPLRPTPWTPTHAEQQAAEHLDQQNERSRAEAMRAAEALRAPVTVQHPPPKRSTRPPQREGR